MLAGGGAVMAGGGVSIDREAVAELLLVFASFVAEASAVTVDTPDAFAVSVSAMSRLSPDARGPREHWIVPAPLAQLPPATVASSTVMVPGTVISILAAEAC